MSQIETKKRECPWLIGNQFAKGQKPNRACFKEGHIPWNKGKKGIHLSPESEFKKGHLPIVHKPTGTITLRAVKGQYLRRFIKISEPNKWLEYAKWVWEKAVGKIPKGRLVHHKNLDELDDRIENLQLVTRAKHMNIHRPQLLKAKERYKRIKAQRKYGISIWEDAF